MGSLEEKSLYTPTFTTFRCHSVDCSDFCCDDDFIRSDSCGQTAQHLLEGASTGVWYITLLVTVTAELMAPYPCLQIPPGIWSWISSIPDFVWVFNPHFFWEAVLGSCCAFDASQVWKPALTIQLHSRVNEGFQNILQHFESYTKMKWKQRKAWNFLLL